MEALFEGRDDNGQFSLWVTDGTVAGTREITGFAGAPVNLTGPGFDPFGFAVLNGEALFDGRGSDNQNNLWATNGTVAGTHELTGVVGESASFFGLFPTLLTSFGNEVLFNGLNTAERNGLWVTDGTAAGTHELTGIANANSGGLDPRYFTVFNGKVLFDGLDTINNFSTSGLWVTDGTAAGTYELTGITGASTGGISPSGLTAFNNEVLFAGVDANFLNGLWITDGTVAGTHELTGIAGANTSGALTSGLLPVGADRFTVFNGEALFDGQNAAGQFGLWVTDGTATGTHELTGINGAYSGGLFGGFFIGNAPPFTVLDGEVLFAAFNTVGLEGLWETDGTAAGTHEITGISGASTGGVFFGIGNNQFVPPSPVVNGEMLFEGTNSDNSIGLWETDGTAAGTHELTGVTAADSEGMQPQEIVAFQPTVPFDLNDDGISDLVFQNNGAPQIWLWNGTSVTSQATLSNPGASWHVVTSRDVNGDGKADLIWQNSDGTPGVWLMNGNTPLAEAGLSNPGADWRLVAAGDVNGDGNADLIWQETGGMLGVWEMNGTTPIAEAGIGNPGANWKVVGTADFNADGRDDILLQNTATGNLMIDLMNGTSVTSTVSITVGDPSWHAVSTGEFNGQAVIAWQNSDGTPGIWLMNGATPIAEATLPNPGAAWQIVSVDHFTANGQPDLLFQNTSGPMGLWEMNGTSLVAEINLPNPGAGWQSVNGHPFASG